LLCFVHCWYAVGTAATKAYLFAASARGVLQMRIHTDRKQLDGAAIAFVVITS
jgi:hypothetical protein